MPSSALRALRALIAAAGTASQNQQVTNLQNGCCTNGGRPLAEIDILEIWDYIADDSLAAADRWVDHLDKQFRVLATQPMMGRARDELVPGVRSFPFGRYVVFYMPLDDGIDVVRVLHGARDIDAVFNSEQ